MIDSQIEHILKDHRNMIEHILTDTNIQKQLNVLVDKTVSVFKNSGRVFFCGNGGSAADAQHLAAELSGRFYKNRPPLDAEALHVNTSYLTAVGNDFHFDHIYERNLQAKSRRGDLLFALSTSGESKNILRAAEYAKSNNIFCVGMTGSKKCSLSETCDITIHIPSEPTPRIQEAHMLVGHIICQLVEEKVFPE